MLFLAQYAPTVISSKQLRKFYHFSTLKYIKDREIAAARVISDSWMIWNSFMFQITRLQNNGNPYGKKSVGEMEFAQEVKIKLLRDLTCIFSNNILCISM